MTRPMDVEDNVVKVITEMSKIPSAIKAWRSPIADLLNDNRLFNCHPDAVVKWKPVVKALFDADKTAISELLGKLSVLKHAIALSRKCFKSKWQPHRQRLSLPIENTSCCCAR
jgi:hypothetical protein